MARFYARIPRTRGTRTEEGLSQREKVKQKRERVDGYGSETPAAEKTRVGRNRLNTAKLGQSPD